MDDGVDAVKRSILSECPQANIWNPACTYDVMEHPNGDDYHFTASSSSLTVFYKALSGFMNFWEFMRQINRVSGLLRNPRALAKP